MHAPSLVTFYHSGDVAKEYILSSFLTLLEVSLYFECEDGDENYATRMQRVGHEEAISQFLGALAHVKRLSVNDTAVQAICFANKLLNHLPTFHNMKHLEILDVPISDKPVIHLLRVTPNLESLVFRLLMDDYGEVPPTLRAIQMMKAKRTMRRRMQLQ
ncbi:uncharacterized protein LOC113313856 [Papaver somniferum]|uniref:uncharacterized protein LOC113313856 n=1 Tax=Papaver somniferum TaxID=3469 RepID=UPI000E6FC82D|nr:uncharacterized protein LOC113313856 [Papaver somniferum]